MSPGHVFDQREIDESLRRLNNIGYFQTVSMNFDPGDEGSVVLIFSVEEGRTGQFSGVFGYNPSEDEVGAQKFTGVLEALETNLLGTDNMKIILDLAKENLVQFKLYINELSILHKSREDMAVWKRNKSIGDINI